MIGRNVILAGASALAILAASGGARAQDATVCVNCTTELTEIMREAARAAQVVKQIETAKAQYDQLVQTYQAIAHLPDTTLQQLAGQLNAQQFRSPLPGSSNTVNGVLNGSGLGNLGTLGQRFLNQNRVYAAPGSDFGVQQMASSANSVAGVQALLNNLYQSAAGHITTLQGLENQLNSSPDEKATADITARLQAEQTYLAAQQVQAQALQTWQASQVRNEEQQRRETRRCQIDEVLAADGAGPLSGGGGCGQSSTNTGAGGGASGTGGISAGDGTSGTGGDDTALNTMTAQSWGQQAAANAQALGVNPSALGAACVMESGCNANVGGSGTITGAFQMKGSTYQADVNAALQTNPDLASQVTSNNDPGSQSIAAAQELKSDALSLQAKGIANPTVLDARALYQWGAGGGPAVALASDDQTMASALPMYSASDLAKNGVGPNMTVGAWRQTITSKLGGGCVATHPPRHADIGGDNALRYRICIIGDVGGDAVRCGRAAGFQPRAAGRPAAPRLRLHDGRGQGYFGVPASPVLARAGGGSHRRVQQPDDRALAGARREWLRGGAAS